MSRVIHIHKNHSLLRWMVNTFIVLLILVGMSNAYSKSSDGDGGKKVALATNITIQTPVDGTVTADTQTWVSGIVSPGIKKLLVNGVPIAVHRKSFGAVVPLDEGRNVVVVQTLNRDGTAATAVVEVIHDSQAPTIAINQPLEGYTTLENTITVAGLIYDEVAGGTGPTVRINGVTAEVSEGAFVTYGIMLAPGLNDIDVVATDAVGNSAHRELTVFYDPPEGIGQNPPEDFFGQIRMISGDQQQAAVRNSLPTELTVEIVDVFGLPVANNIVVFEVTRNNGMLNSALDEEQVGRSLAVKTDASGLASVQFTLGDRAGAGVHRVKASAPGVAGEVEFSATALPEVSSDLVVVAGDDQHGIIGEDLVRPFEAVIIDSYGNPISGIDVKFEVVEGGGEIEGDTIAFRPTDAQGVARTRLTLGSEVGKENNRVRASAYTVQGLSHEVIFVASAAAPGELSATSLTGLVLDEQKQPISGVRVSVKGTFPSTLTDESGKFTLSSVPTGNLALSLDPGGTSHTGAFPSLTVNAAAVAGQQNQLDSSIILTVLDTESSQIVGGDQDVTLRTPGGLEMTVSANSVIFPNGARTGRLTLTEVAAGDMPGTPPAGTAFMPVAWVIQPAGVVFEQPAQVRITMPELQPQTFEDLDLTATRNLGLPLVQKLHLQAGRVLDTVHWVPSMRAFSQTGKVIVTEKGTHVVSDIGTGVTRSGWGGIVSVVTPVSLINTLMSMSTLSSCISRTFSISVSDSLYSGGPSLKSIAESKVRSLSVVKSFSISGSFSSSTSSDCTTLGSISVSALLSMKGYIPGWGFDIDTGYGVWAYHPYYGWMRVVGFARGGVFAEGSLSGYLSGGFTKKPSDTYGSFNASVCGKASVGLGANAEAGIKVWWDHPSYKYWTEYAAGISIVGRTGVTAGVTLSKPPTAPYYYTRIDSHAFSYGSSSLTATISAWIFSASWSKSFSGYGTPPC